MSAQDRGTTRARRARSLALGLSILVHLIVLGWFGLRQAQDRAGAETRAVEVQLVRLPPPTPPKPDDVATPPSASAARPAIDRVEAAETRPVAAQPQAGPGSGTGSSDLFGPVFADGQWPRREPGLRQRCDPLKDPERRSAACRREDEIARGVSRANDPQNGRDSFAREARRKDAIRRYRDGTGETPTMPCMVFNAC